MSEFAYVGSELDLFADVHHWKSYWSGEIRKFVRGDILEVGAGIGSNTAYLDDGGRHRFVCLEPDARLVEQLRDRLKDKPARYEIVCGTLESFPLEERFDTIVYIDVLEHIEDDGGELRRAASHLQPGGRVIVLSPAHQRLFTAFDAAIGHFRRYDKPMLKAISLPGLELEACSYLDSVGLFASAANLLLLKQSMPSKEQLRFWDTYIVAISRIADRLSGHAIGKSIVATWRRKA